MKKKTLLFLPGWLLFYFLFGQEQGHLSPEQIAKINHNRSPGIARWK
jgi:hypothetical protein